MAPGGTTWPDPMTHWARVAPAPTRLPLPMTVGPMIVAPSPTSAPSCSTTGPTRLAEGWTRTSGAARRAESPPSRGQGEHHALVQGQEALLGAQVDRSSLEGQVPAGHALGGEDSPEARQGRERQLVRDAQARHRDQGARDTAGERPGHGVVVALNAPDATRGIRVHVLLGALAAPLEGHEVLDTARVVRLR